MFNAEAVSCTLARGKVCRVRTEALQGGGKRRNGIAVGQISDGVDVHLVACSGPLGGDCCEGGGVDEEGAGGIRVVGIGVEHGAAPATKSTICEC